MAGPEAQASVEEFAKRIAILEAGASAEMVSAYAPVWRDLQRDIIRLVTISQTQNLTPYQTLRLARYKTLERKLLSNVSKFAESARGQITRAQLAAVGLAQTSARATAGVALPQGIDFTVLSGIGIDWVEIPEDALVNFIGIAGDGQPVGNLLATLGPEMATSVKAEVASGLALGKSPRTVANTLRKTAGMPLSKALLISRTETNRAYREASRLQYAQNSDIIKGYRRLATKSNKTCVACIALDGTLYETQEPLDSHPNCRCAIVPETITYRDLGLDVDMPETAPTAEDWLKTRPEGEQIKIMGKQRHEQWQSGTPLTKFVQINESSVWGKSATVAPLSK